MEFVGLVRMFVQFISSLEDYSFMGCDTISGRNLCMGSDEPAISAFIFNPLDGGNRFL
jgi:hypothetical protein